MKDINNWYQQTQRWWDKSEGSITFPVSENPLQISEEVLTSTQFPNEINAKESNMLDEFVIPILEDIQTSGLEVTQSITTKPLVQGINKLEAK